METPSRIGKYELLQFLGGGMSHVYRATDTVLKRTVAVKILTEQGCTDREAKARFLQEAITAGNIQHENIIKVYDYGEDNGRPFIVMEFLTGEDLRDAIHKGHTGNILNRLSIALSVARALLHVHEKHIIHRDIKPENIHIDQKGQVRLMDFGIAKAEGFSMTKTGFALGTPYYMAPEQVLGHPATERVDVYAFGVLLYELMSGAKPFTGDSVERLFYLILHESPDIAVLQRLNVPDPICALIARSTAKRPEDRPADFHAVIQEIERIVALLGQGGGQPSPGAGASGPQLRDGVTVAAAAATPPQSSAAPPAAVAGGGPPLTTIAGPSVLSDPGAGAIPSGPPAQPPTSQLGPIIAVAAVVLVLGSVGGYFALRDRIRGGGKQGQQQQQQNNGNGGGQKQGQNQAALPPTLETESGQMLLVPAGTFVFGDDSTKNRASMDLAAFYIDRTEVTNAAWARYATAAGKAAPRGKPDFPVTGITIIEARDFARWASKRLPTAAEWEKAARGADGRWFPWGNDPDAKRANVGTKRLGPAAGLPEWPSPTGALNMAGNVWEFVEGAVTPSEGVVKSWAAINRLKPAPTAAEPWVSVRGGSFENPIDFARLFEWLPVPERATGPDIGFRCVKDGSAVVPAARP
jgi:eukaryotic-like serine/threonine-protein kinase